jgi:hypothetical protein
MHGHTASGCLCRSRRLQWYLVYLLRLSGCPKSSQRDAPSSVVSLFGIKSNQQVLNLIEHSHFSLGQKLLYDCHVVHQISVYSSQPLTEVRTPYQYPSCEISSQFRHMISRIVLKICRIYCNFTKVTCLICSKLHTHNEMNKLMY